ncbi:MAG: trypsin-like serine protease [Archangium sp.]
MQPRHIVFALVACLTACGPVEEPSIVSTARSDEIIGGTVANGDPAVVSLSVRVGGSYESLCTGTLIAPKTVITAAHCIYAYGQNLQYYVTIGTSAAAPSSAVQVAQQYKNPSYNQTAWDFGLLRLSSPIVGVTPIPLNETPMTSAHVGRAIRHVGFGLTVAGGQTNGTKREVTYNLRQVRQYTIESGAQGKQTCQGDSGGPAFMIMPGDTQEKLVGVVSYGDQNCSIEGWDGRVDIALSWIRSTMGMWEQPTCATDGACVMNCMPAVDQDCVCKADGACSAECLDSAMDPDCPRDCAANQICATQGCGRPDPDCIDEGLLCDAPVQCRARLCVSDAQNPNTYCTKQCASNNDCPATMECAVGTCRIKQKPVRGFLETCTMSDFCGGTSNLICTGPASAQISRCVKSCVSGVDCPSGSTCEAGFDSQRYCRPPDVRWQNITLPAIPNETGAVPSGCSTGAGIAVWLALGALVRRRGRRLVA